MKSSVGDVGKVE